jgi:hypothetical protein
LLSTLGGHLLSGTAIMRRRKKEKSDNNLACSVTTPECQSSSSTTRQPKWRQPRNLLSAEVMVDDISESGRMLQQVFDDLGVASSSLINTITEDHLEPQRSDDEREVLILRDVDDEGGGACTIC